MNKLFEAKLNLPQEYIDKVTTDARKKYGHGITRQDLQQMMSLQSKVFPLQKGHEEELNKLCLDVINKFYGSILNDVDLDIKIVDPYDKEKLQMVKKMINQSNKQKTIEVNLPKGSTEEGIEADIDKRKLINTIMQGEAHNVYDMMYDVKDEIAKITGSDEIVDMYMEILKINTKYEWDESLDYKQTIEQMPEAANAMETNWEEGAGEGGSDKPSIKARAMLFPLLIHETVKGIYELIATGAIDPDAERAQKVIDATDSLTDEHEDVKFGPYIARDIRTYINDVADKISGANDIENLKEFIFGKLILLPSADFVKIITGMLMNEAWVKQPMTKIINEIIEEHKQYNLSQQTSYSGQYDYNEDEYNEPEQEPIIEQPKKEDISKKLASMGKNELNFQLNKAIDEEDWETAKLIQQAMEKRGMLKESKKNSVEFKDETKWMEQVGTLLHKNGISFDDIEDYMLAFSDDLNIMFTDNKEPKEAVNKLKKKFKI